ncbi:hypothetical protein CP533_3748 [Ophiocordyceps camponoti-saundersi (nom. inval.)]|nr:hypothetical protein CP533_3748 [Ophiocordyceps camponoti-saundersi (nom. inval.)]
MFDSGVLFAQGHRATNGKLNGKPASWSKRAKRRRGFFSWASHLVARLAIWSAIFTVLFRCPSSLEACDETSPYICKNYFLAKNAVAPHLQPYYHRYAAPYVHIAKPYYDSLDSHILTPTRTYALHFGAPWVNWARDYAWSQWEINGQPRLAQVQSLSAVQYNRFIAPYLAQAGGIVEPYYGVVRSNFLQFYYDYAMPSYDLIHPHAVRGYSVARQFTSTTALPATYWVWNKGNAFLETAVWPQLRSLYVENVEPQLVRIGERLGRYKNKAQSKVLHRPSSSSSFSSNPVVSSQKTVHPDTTLASSATEETFVPDDADDSIISQDAGPRYIHPVEPPTALENEDAEGRAVREMVTRDLETWQEKFMSQAEEKAHEIEDRVDAIARRNIETHILTTGKQLLEQLHSTTKSEVDQLKRNIISIVKTNPQDAQESALAVVRSAGVAVKNSAQAIREWHEKFDAQLKATVHDDVEEYFDILDETRSLALQKIGMKWAWTNGISYHDWAKYHELKNALTKLTDELRELVVTHPGLVEAQDSSAQVEDEAMTVAADAAKELARLKDVARWKILAGDSTDNFDIRAMKVAAEDAGNEPAESQSQTDRGSEKAFDKGYSPASNMADSIRETLSSVTRSPSTDAHSGVEEAHQISHDLNPPESDPRGAGREVGPESFKQDVSAQDNFHIVSTSVGIVLPIRSTSANAPPDNPGLAPTAEPDDSHEERDANLKPIQSGTLKVKPVAFGAAAHEVSDRRPILEDVGESDIYASATSAAQAAYSSAMSAASGRYSSALSVVSAQVYGTPMPVHEQLLASVSAAYGNAVSAASQRLDKAVSAASHGVYGEPTPTNGFGSLSWEKVESIAAQRLNEGRLWAEVQYQSALIAIGMATATANPTASTDAFVEQARFRYYAGLGIAHDRYTSFLSAASSAWSSVTATPTPTDFVGSASSLASEARESASSAAKAAGSAAQAAGSAAQSAYSAATENVASAARAVDDSVSSVADAASEQMFLAGVAIADTWERVVSELSVQVYAEPTAIGWHDRLVEGAGSYASAATKTAADRAATATEAVCDAADAASSQVARQLGAVSEIVSELVSGREPAFSESVLSRLGAVYATASASFDSVASEVSASAASVGERVGSAASQATEAVKESVQKGRDEL